MATFSQWLAGNEDGPQDSPVAWLARQWRALEGKRPRVSSPSGIERHLLTLAPPEAAQADQWTGYVHQAVAEATAAYKTDKQAGPKASSGEAQPTLPGVPEVVVNEATGKPVAVVGQNQWRAYPNAAEMGSCTTCGWARGIADIGAGEQMMCAAGHVFTPQKPDPVIIHNEQTGETITHLSGPLTPIVSPGGAGSVMTGSDPEHDAACEQAAGDAAEVDLLELVNLKLTTIMISLGLPTSPREMAGLILAAADQAEQAAGSLTGQLAGPGPQAWDGMPADLAALYQLADPDATEQ